MGKPNFEAGHPKYGGAKAGFSQAVKRKYLNKWEQVFDSTDPIKKLTDLANKDYPEFLRLGLAAMPKDIMIQENPFEKWTTKEITQFLASGEYPDNE